MIITNSENFYQITEKASRKIVSKFEVDWDLTNSFINETGNLLVVEVERKVDEPLGGVSLSIADVVLANHNDRYTPPID